VPEPLRFALVSRGDPISGRLWIGPAEAARPLVLVTPALGSSTDAPEVAALCRALAAAGLAAAALDLPLQGERASRKLSARLLACTHGERSDSDQRLWNAFLQQAALDLAAAAGELASRVALDLAATAGELASRAALDARQLGCIAFDPGGEAALEWAAREPRVRALRRITGNVAIGEVVAFVRERLRE
jgi:dienelactone hydrolase